MKIFVTLILLFAFGKGTAQERDCFCDRDTLMNNATADCETVLLKNKAKLYWQFNCDRIWLTLESRQGQKIVLNEVDPELYGYTFRLGFFLVKEYENSLLFRSGCPANGPCLYTLIHKDTGRVMKGFSPLICADFESQWASGDHYPYDFVVYFSNDYRSLMIYYIDRNQLLRVPFQAMRNGLNARVPEQQFDKMVLNGNLLVLDYTNDDGNKRKLNINLRNKKYAR